MMRLEQFEYINAVAEYHSMNAAAQHLHVSQQNISKSIKQLEKELNIEIFKRTQKGAYLTAKGTLVAQFAKEQLEAYKNLKDRLWVLQKEKISGQLVVCTMNSGTCMIVPEMLSKFYKSYPNVDLKIIDEKAYEVVNQVEQEVADIGIVTYAIVRDQLYPRLPEGLKLFPLMTGEWYYWVAKNTSFAKNGEITFKDANKLSILVDEAIDLDFLLDLYKLFGLKANLGYRSRNLHVLGRLVAEQQGVLPDIRLGTGELLYGFALENQSGLASVPVVNHQGYTGLGYIVKTSKSLEPLLRFTTDYLQKLFKKELVL